MDGWLAVAVAEEDIELARRRRISMWPGINVFEGSTNRIGRSLREVEMSTFLKQKKRLGFASCNIDSQGLSREKK